LTIEQAVAQTNHLPFDRLRASGDMLKSCNFSGHAEPFLRPCSGHSEKNRSPCPGRVEPGRLSKGERFAQPPAQAPPQLPARREGLLPRRESLWLGEDRLVEA